MNPAKSYVYLFSPFGGDVGDNYRAFGLIMFLRSAHVPLNAEALKACGAKYAFVGVPFDEGNIGKPGSEDAPREFRLITQEYFSYWFEYNVDLHGKAVDCGDVSMPKVSPEVAHERIYRAVREVLKSGLIPIICGGDRSISITAARALSDHIGPQKKMGYMHFGAQLDMADSWAGERNLAPCAMARITELPNLDIRNVAHLGARNAMNPKDHIDLSKERGLQYDSMFDLFDAGIYPLVERSIDRVWSGTDAQYLGFNFNVMDSSTAPGVTSTEPGGLESREMMRIVDMIAKRGGVSVIDLTELCPIFDISGTAARLAACVIMRLMASLAAQDGDVIDDKLRRTDLVAAE